MKEFLHILQIDCYFMDAFIANIIKHLCIPLSRNIFIMNCRFALTLYKVLNNKKTAIMIKKYHNDGS